MVFSDNVSLADEIALKEMAHERGLLMMGPDCGTAVINACRWASPTLSRAVVSAWSAPPARACRK